MQSAKSLDKRTIRRRKRVKRRLNPTEERPRLVVFRSNKHIYAQLVDNTGKVLTGSASTSPQVRSQVKKGMKKEDISLLVGAAVAEKAVKQGIKQVVFDRAEYRYHGRVKALADAARKAGLKF
ncbi:MAG: 50S ribosomal protein L18 [candidate division Zixibacteria bacterium]|nr:50S ribosomal protein L18 [candidate division Zixibacteria bacterium]